MGPEDEIMGLLKLNNYPFHSVQQQEVFLL